MVAWYVPSLFPPGIQYIKYISICFSACNNNFGSDYIFVGVVSTKDAAIHLYAPRFVFVLLSLHFIVIKYK